MLQRLLSSLACALDVGVTSAAWAGGGVVAGPCGPNCGHRTTCVHYVEKTVMVPTYTTEKRKVMCTEYKQEKRDHFKVGDGVKVHVKVREGGKERIQVFAGIVIARKGAGIHETFTVRRIASGVGVERVFPVHSPLIDKVEVDR